MKNRCSCYLKSPVTENKVTIVTIFLIDNQKIIDEKIDIGVLLICS